MSEIIQIPYIQILIYSSLSTILLLSLFKFLSPYIGAIAIPNERSSHDNPTPTGGGIVISLVTIWSLIYFLFYIEQVPNDVFTIFVGVSMGALAISIVGFIDDLVDTSAMTKLIIQIILCFWIIHVFFGNIASIIYIFEGLTYWPVIFLGLFLLVWLINVFNFMDAIDGMALSGSSLIAISAGYIIFLSEGANLNSMIFFILAGVCISFLIFNFPPASIFMGDSGSLFLGYYFGCMIIKTIIDNDLSYWTWLILLSHFLVETTLSTLLRIKLTRMWYKAHRALAYQNLARILDSHKLVTLGSVLHYLIWLFPLALLSFYYEHLAFLFFLLALIPSVIVTLRYGPLFSNE